MRFLAVLILPVMLALMGGTVTGQDAADLEWGFVIHAVAASEQGSPAGDAGVLLIKNNSLTHDYRVR
jgi:hypothetical protein